MTTNKEKSIEDLKNYMNQCKEKYNESFKTNSCATILKTYNDWKHASKMYYSVVSGKNIDDDFSELLKSVENFDWQDSSNCVYYSV